MPSIGDLVGARHLVGEQRRAGAQRALGEQQAGGAAGEAEHQRFDEQLLQHAAAPGAERGADRDLLAAAERAREQQVADVGAGDQQHEADGGEQHHQRRADVADDVVLQRTSASRPSRRWPAGYACSSRFAITSSCDRASSARMPGFRRATACQVVVLADGAVLGGQRERHPQVAGHRRPTTASEAEAGMTPTMV